MLMMTFQGGKTRCLYTSDVFSDALRTAMAFRYDGILEQQMDMV